MNLLNASGYVWLGVLLLTANPSDAFLIAGVVLVGGLLHREAVNA